jgi:hypothetical protein
MSAPPGKWTVETRRRDRADTRQGANPVLRPCIPQSSAPLSVLPPYLIEFLVFWASELPQLVPQSVKLLFVETRGLPPFEENASAEVR